jgi:methylenetetrahydrofolate--tRNA-(uracil-5-)-methyltransferase
MSFDFRVIGAGLAGSEAALTLAALGYRVEIFEQKPLQRSAAHVLDGAAELVCSNSLKSLDAHAAHGLLKEELFRLGSPLLKLAVDCSLPGGKALVVDREKWSEVVTEKLKTHPLIEWRSERVDELPADTIPTLIATGPLTSDSLMQSLRRLLNDDGLYFYDATSPVVSLDSLDLSHFFWAGRNQENEDYLNLPLTKEQYLAFREDLLTAEKTGAHHPDETLKFFEGCLPIEELARRGELTMAYSCLKPKGFDDRCPPNTFAVIQFRRERAAGELLSLVGFQTQMKWPEQVRVFRRLPGMANAEFVRLGAMHRNSFINAPLHLNDRYQLNAKPHLFMAGQITGSEGYTEAIATGHSAALMMAGFDSLPEETALRSLIRFLTQSDPKHFQPMNFNFGLLPPLPQKKTKMKKELHVERAREALSQWGESQSIRLGSLWNSAFRISSELVTSTESLAPTLSEPNLKTVNAS